MEVKILKLQDIDPKEWSSLLNSNNSSVFNTLEWLSVWEKTYKNATPLFLVEQERGATSNGLLKAGLPVVEIQKFGFKSYYSMPYGDYGALLRSRMRDPICNTQEVRPQDDGRKNIVLLSSFDSLARGRWGMLSFSDFYGEASYLSELGFKKLDAITHILKLPNNCDALWQALPSTKRQMVRQAERKDVKISLVQNEPDVHECYKMICDTALRHKEKTPTFPLRFYINLFNTMGNLLRWCIAKRGNELLANIINFIYKDTITYWDSGSYVSALRYRPNDALIWDTIRWGCENNYKYYDLRSSPTPGLAKFKQEWGAEERHYSFYYKKSVPFTILKTFQPRRK